MISNDIRHNEHIRSVVALVGFSLIIYFGTNLSTIEAMPLLTIFTVITLYDVMNKEFETLRRYKHIIIGSAIIVSSFIVFVVGLFVSGIIALLSGLWFVFDGIITFKYKLYAGEDKHPIISNKKTSLFQLHTTLSILQTVKMASEPKTTEEIADSLDISMERVSDDLDLLVQQGYIEATDAGFYRRSNVRTLILGLTRLVTWVPKRIIRPFYIMYSNRTYIL